MSEKVRPDASSTAADRLTGGHHADSLVPLIYRELRAAAGRIMSGERKDHTLQPTALVHEAYAKLAKAGMRYEDDSHFFYAAAQAMRQILIDHAVSRRRQKRGGKQRLRIELKDSIVPAEQTEEMDWVALDEALDKLAEISPRRSQVVMLRFFSGLNDSQIAGMLHISEPTVRRDWSAARLWLYREMTTGDEA